MESAAVLSSSGGAGNDEARCSPEELKEKLERGDDFVLLDVRTAQELEYARIRACLHIPLNELPKRLAELDAMREKEIVALCHHGSRSGMAQRFLIKQGFEHVRNLVGGIDAYAKCADPSVGRY